MEIYEALPGVHFRFGENGHLLRCCGRCGETLPPGAADPCGDACRERETEILPAGALLESDVLLCGANDR